MAEYKLSYTASEVDAKLGKVDEHDLSIRNLSQEITNIGVSSLVEPMKDDIPKVFIDGVIPATKDEVLAEMTYISKTEHFHVYLKIKCQGNSSMKFPKKNFTIKMYSDGARKTKEKKVFKDWGHTSNKYVLKANWVDHSHARNIVSARLWSEIVSARNDYSSLPNEIRNSPNNGAVDGFPVKLYTNGEYQGLYTWNIGKDDWMFGMDEDNANHVVLCAETNTDGTFAETPCNFRALWSGVDEQHWTVEIGTNSDAVKNSLNALISCVKDTDDETFKATIGNYLDLQSAMDYYIHQYIVCGIDGLAKNMLLLTYDGTKWICGAYDMDCTFGGTMSNDYFRNSDTSVPEDCNEQYSLLWSRIEGLFAEKLVARYDELRSSVLSVTNIISNFEEFISPISKDVYVEDGEVYPDIPSLNTSNIKQIRNFVVKRLKYCDKEFHAMIPQEYTPITYLESDGNQFIDTGVSGGTNASYEIGFTHTPNYVPDTYDCVLSGDNTGAPCLIYYEWDGYHFTTDRTTFQVDLGGLYNEALWMQWYRYNSDGTSERKTSERDWYTIEPKLGDTSMVSGRGWGDKNWHIFGNAYNGGACPLRLYYLKMYTDGVLVRDFIPVQRSSDGVYGMYDNVSGEFFGNSGSGAFIGA